MFPTNTHEVLSASQANHAWSIALETAYFRALDAYPQEKKRIKAGYKLIDFGAVRVNTTHAIVQSQSTVGKEYHVDEECGCSWFTYGAREGERRRCAHRWAYLLYHKAIDRLVNLYAAVYSTVDADGKVHDCEGFAQAFPEDSGYLFFHASTGTHRFLPAPCSNLVLLGKVAWIEDDKLCGSLPEAVRYLTHKG